MPVFEHNEVLLYGKRFKTRGPLRKALVSVFPGKVVVGDYTRDAEQLASSWILSNFIGGLGKARIDASTDAERFDFSTLETRYRDQLSLLPLAHDAGGIPGKSHVRAGCDFNNQLYVAFDDTVARWDNPGWTSMRTLAHNATSAITFRASDGVARVYFASGDDIDFFDGISWTNLPGPGAYQYLAIFDDKLYAIGTNGQLSFSLDGVSFDSTGLPRLPTETSMATGLVVYFDAAGDPALYVATKQGLYVYDVSAQKLRATRLSLPRYETAGRGLADFQGNLYMASGLDVYVYTINTVAHVGLNRDHGLPSIYKGEILCLVPAQSWLFAVLDVESLATTSLVPLFTGTIFDSPVMGSTSGFGALFAWDGKGWHTIFAPAVMDQGSKWAGLSLADGSYRLWFGADKRAYYMDLARGIHNPLRNPAAQFADSGYLVSGWFDGGWAELQKVAASIKLRVRGLSEDETVTVEYGLDGDEAFFSLATLTQDGLHTIALPNAANPEGVPFYSIRIRLSLTRGPDASKTPVVDFLALKFLKQLDALWGWNISIDASEAYNGMTPEEIVAELERLAGIKTLGAFEAYDEDGPVKTMVKITRLALDGRTGTDSRRTIQLSVAEI